MPWPISWACTIPSWTPKSSFLRYGLALVTVVGATFLRLLLDPLLGFSIPYITYFLAITLSGWIGGGAPAIFAVMASALTVDYFFLEPRYSLVINSTEDWIGEVVFIAMGGMIALTCEAMKEAQCRAEQQSQLLDHHSRALQVHMKEIESHKEALCQSEERLRLAAEGGGLVVWDFNLRTQEVISSPNGKEIWGRDYGKLSDFLARVHPDDRTLFKTARKTAMVEKIIPIVEYRVTDQKGRLRWLQSRGHVRYDNDGLPIRFLGVSIDVTQRKHMEQRIKEGESRFSSFMQHLSAAAWIKDRHGRYVYANPTAHGIFKTTEQTLCGKTDKELFAPETAKQFSDNDQEVLKSGKGLQRIELLPQEDGLHYSIVSKFPIFDMNEESAFVGGIAFDVTEWKKSEAERERLLVEVQNERKRLQASQEQLQETIRELELFHDVVIGRELNMIALEKEIAKLRDRLDGS